MAQNKNLKPDGPRAFVGTKQRRQQNNVYLTCFSVCIAVFCVGLTTLIGASSAAKATPIASSVKHGNITHAHWRRGYEGHGTAHEQTGQPHFPPVTYSDYKSKVNYTKKPSYSSIAMDPIYNVTHFIFDNIITDEPAIPPGYLVVKDQDTLALGPKVEQNEWRDLVAHYWLILLWVLFWAILIVVMPFIAVCYCCFCCCRRCRQSRPPPCDRSKDGILRCCYGLLLLLLIVGLIFGVIIALVTNKHLDRGFQKASSVMKHGSDDTCKFLKDVSDHIHHLFVNNYQELETHIVQELNEAHKHIFLDLTDTSESGAIEELLRILTNMPEAFKLMTEVDKMEKDIRFYGAQLRDGVRGVKRDANYAAINLCGTYECEHFLKESDIQFVDVSPCLHYDTVPNTTIFVDGIEAIIEEKYIEIPKLALARLKEIRDKVKEQIGLVIPPLIKEITAGGDIFRRQATNVRNIIDSALSDIQLNTKRSTKSFDSIYDKFGPDRNVINIIACTLLILILLILTISLLYGCCGKRARGYRDDCCNKRTGASCLLLAISLILTVFSVLALIGLFYFMVGLVTYHGACAPLRDQEKNALFRQLDSVVDLNRYLPHKKNAQEKTLPPLRISNAINACQKNQTIYELLRINNLYDVNDISRIKVLSLSLNASNAPPIFNEDLSKIILLTDQEKTKLNHMRNGNLSSYHSSLYLDNICQPFTPTSLPSLAARLRSIANLIHVWPHYNYYYAYTSFQNEAKHLDTYQTSFVTELERLHTKLKEKVLIIDKLILYGNHNFTDSIGVLVDAIVRAENFIKTRGKDYVNSLGANLTSYMQQTIINYQKMVIRESNENVGHCAPLASIYDRCVEMICHGLVDPMNGFWIGILLCCLLFLPTLWVAQKLLRLYKKVDPYVAPGVGEGGEYLYDAYSEREHMPLANLPKKRRKAYDRRCEQQEYYLDGPPSPTVARPVRAEASGSSNMRYNDMAPTHWDHEPPRYHNPPTVPPSSEYERPPPYYYPGATEQE